MSSHHQSSEPMNCLSECLVLGLAGGQQLC
jgi:hypothetical protein